MRDVFKIFFVVLLLVITGPVPVFSQSLSDMNLPGFKKKTTPEISRSPFTPARPTEDEIAISDLVLTGIILGKEDAFALVSGYILQTGDKIAGYRVSAIESNRVTLQKLDQIYILRLGGEL